MDLLKQSPSKIQTFIPPCRLADFLFCSCNTFTWPGHGGLFFRTWYYDFIDCQKSAAHGVLYFNLFYLTPKLFTPKTQTAFFIIMTVLIFIVGSANFFIHEVLNGRLMDSVRQDLLPVFIRSGISRRQASETIDVSKSAFFEFADYGIGSNSQYFIGFVG